jgi:hypothetical protein
MLDGDNIMYAFHFLEYYDLMDMIPQVVMIRSQMTGSPS